MRLLRRFIGAVGVVAVAFTWPAATRLTLGHQVDASALHRHAASRPHKKICVSKSIDTFSNGPYLMNLTQNASLAVTHARIGKSSGVGVLQANATAPDQAFSVGRRFPAAQNWHTANGIGLWYFGRRTGKRVGVQILGREAPDPGPAGWKLAWSDEFNGPTGAPPNPAVWNHDLGDGSANGNPGWGNHELE